MIVSGTPGKEGEEGSDPIGDNMARTLCLLWSALGPGHREAVAVVVWA